MNYNNTTIIKHPNFTNQTLSDCRLGIRIATLFEDGSEWETKDKETDVSLGEINYSVYKDSNGDKFGYLEKILVFPGYRGHGIGSRLLNELFNHLKNLGCRYLVGELASDDIQKEPRFTRRTAAR